MPAETHMYTELDYKVAVAAVLKYVLTSPDPRQVLRTKEFSTAVIWLQDILDVKDHNLFTARPWFSTNEEVDTYAAVKTAQLEAHAKKVKDDLTVRELSLAAKRARTLAALRALNSRVQDSLAAALKEFE